MTTSDNQSNTGRGRRSKVARLIDEYGMHSVGVDLEQFWTADEDRRSLRELATYFNQRLVERVLDEAGVRALDGEIENIYRLLTDDNSADQTRIRRRFERDGVDVDALDTNFVTYQAIRTYLNEHRNVEYEPKEIDPIERDITNIQKIRGRTTSVTEGKVEQLRKSEHIQLGEFRILIDLRVVCEECDSQFDVIELLQRGHCNCVDS